MSNEKLERIKVKIAKLMNLAEKATNEHEAANAMSKARALMDAYQLDMVDVEVIGGVETAFLRTQASRYYAAMHEYISWLGVGIARFNDCQCVYEYGAVTRCKKEGDELKMGKALMFRGLREDVELAVEMFTRIQAVINGLCSAYHDSLGLPRYSMKIGTAYKSGATLTILSKLELETERRKAEQAAAATTGTSLMIVKENAIAKYFGDVEYKKSKMKSRVDNDAATAEAAGRFEARDVNPFAREIGDKSNKNRIGKS